MHKYWIVTIWVAAAAAQNPPSRVVGKMIWDGRVVTYEVVNGRVVIDGDVIVSTTNERAGLQPHSDITPAVTSSVWPKAIVPYEIDPAIPNPQRVMDAITQWNDKTPLRFVPRGNET